MTTDAVVSYTEAGHDDLSRTASELVEDDLRIYGAHIGESQFPSDIGGLKKIHTRIIFALSGFTNRIKSTKSVGEILVYHNHGDLSIYEAAVRMSAVHAFRPPLIDLYGDNGSYAGHPMAASRYTEMALTKFVRDVFLDIDQTTLDMRLSIDRESLEPAHFIPAIPVALLYGMKAVGYGYQHISQPRNLVDVCKLTAAYCQHMARTPHLPFPIHQHAAKLLPDFPILNTITNEDELIKAYSRGNWCAKILMDGEVEISHDAIHIKTIPYGKAFDKVREAIEVALNHKGDYLDQAVACSPKDLSNEEAIGDILIEIRRTHNVFEVWDHIKNLIQFSGSLTPILNYTNADGFIYERTPPVILQAWYQQRYDAIMATKRHRLSVKRRDLSIINAQLTIADHTDEVIDIIKNRTSILADAVAILMTRFRLTEFQATHLTKLTFAQLSPASREEMERRRDRLIQEIEEIRQSFARIPLEIAENAMRIAKEYGTPRSSILPRYIGCVVVGGGFIQIESTDEIEDILVRFPKGPVCVHMYDGPNLLWISPVGRVVRNAVPKIGQGEVTGMLFPGDRGYTVNITPVEDRKFAACVVPGVIPGLRSAGFFYTTKDSIVIARNGDVRRVDITDNDVISQRKMIGRGSINDIVYVYPDAKSKMRVVGDKRVHYIVVVNDSSPNRLTLQRITEEASRVIVAPVGTMEVVHSYSGKDWYFTVPDQYLNRMPVRVFHITDAEALLDGEKSIIIELGQAKYKKHPHLKML